VKQKEKEELFHLAKTAALAAGEHLRDKGENWRKLETATGHDVKIRADRESERLIIDWISSAGFSIFSEEAGLVSDKERKANSGYVWIVDPLDGSLNYHKDIPISCVSIALYNDTQPIIGVVYDFNRDELFSGLVGSGAWLNQQPIQPSAVNEISNAVLATGFPVNTDFSSTALAHFIGEIQQFRKIRLFGTAALSLCYVACGRIDAYREDRIMFWDVAAGLALLKSAGGVLHVKNFEHPGASVNVVATNGVLRINGEN
jgi:myo-inositol-1(or 4)-monophosphatase